MASPAAPAVFGHGARRLRGRFGPLGPLLDLMAVVRAQPRHRGLRLLAVGERQRLGLDRLLALGVLGLVGRLGLLGLESSRSSARRRDADRCRHRAATRRRAPPRARRRAATRRRARARARRRAATRRRPGSCSSAGCDLSSAVSGSSAGCDSTRARRRDLGVGLRRSPARPRRRPAQVAGCGGSCSPASSPAERRESRPPVSTRRSPVGTREPPRQALDKVDDRVPVAAQRATETHSSGPRWPPPSGPNSTAGIPARRKETASDAPSRPTLVVSPSVYGAVAPQSARTNGSSGSTCAGGRLKFETTVAPAIPRTSSRIIPDCPQVTHIHVDEASVGYLVQGVPTEDPAEIDRRPVEQLRALGRKR